jgi:hypothetical protein
LQRRARKQRKQSCSHHDEPASTHLRSLRLPLRAS